MNKTKLYAMMKEIIGCSELTHEIVGEYLASGFWNTRKLLPWEHCGKKFQEMYFPMRRDLLNKGIHYCRYQDKSYYFGIDLNEPKVTDDMLKNGHWLVYTWSD